jgi:Leucine-rich repeat (LRR) protein
MATSRYSSGTTLASSTSDANNNSDEKTGQDFTSSQIQFLNSFATPFPKVRQQQELKSSPPGASAEEEGGGKDPMSWMHEEDLEEEWISEPPSDGEGDEEGDVNNSVTNSNVDMDTTKQHISVKEKASTPEWKKAMNQSKIPIRPKSSLESLFKPPTLHQHQSNTVKSLDAIPESNESRSSGRRGGTVNESHVDSSQDDINSSKGLSSSPLKVFQKHDTYTNSRFEGLLGSLDDQKQSSAPSQNDSSNSIVIGRSQKNVNEVTTQDYMNDADELFNRIRAHRELPAQNNNDLSTSNATYTEDEYDSSNNHQQQQRPQDEEFSSLHELEYSLKQHQPEHNDSSDQSSSSYFNSVKGRFERGSSSFIQRPGEDSKPKQPVTASSPNKHHPAMALIGPEDVKGIIPENLGSMDFDRDNLRWRRKGGTGTSATDFGTGSTKVDSDKMWGTNPISKDGGSEADVFEGIDDLTDNSNAMKPKADNKVTKLERYSEEKSHPATVATASNDDDTSAKNNPLDNQPSELRDSVSGGETETDSARSSIVAGLQQDKSKKVFDYPNGESYNNSDTKREKTKDSEEQLVADATTEIERDDQQDGVQEVYITPRVPSKGILGNSTMTTSNSKREVSFKIPSSHFKSTPVSFNNHNPGNHSLNHNVTNISQVETSYSMGYGTLVKVLTDLGRNEPYWDQYENLQLSGLGLDSLMRLDEICPALKTIELSNNKLSFVTGAPPSLRSMIVSNNNLTDLASFGQLPNLQYLSIDNNRYERLNGLANLYHLRELNVDNNHLVSLDGISHLDGLIRLSVSGNDLNNVDFTGYSWKRLEDLILTGNNIKRVRGLESLPGLTKLTIDDNEIHELECQGKHKKLRKLSLRNNQLEELDVSAFVGLKELQLDENNVVELIGVEKLKRLETLSVKYQKRRGRQDYDYWASLSDLRKLKLSGNIMTNTNSLPTLREPFLNLQVLELSGMGLKTLPKYFDEFMINLRELDLSFNNLKDISCLMGIPKLKRVYLYSNKIESMDQVIDCVNQWGYISVLDLRQNPITDKLYPSLLEEAIITRRLPSRYQRTRTKAAQQIWNDKDMEFLEQADPTVSKERMRYQGVILAANRSSSLRWLDGWLMKTKDKEQLCYELQHLLGM